MSAAGALPRKKKTPQPKHRLPVLNWVAMKSNQVKGTVFSELDDEKLYSVCIVMYADGHWILLIDIITR